MEQLHEGVVPTAQKKERLFVMQRYKPLLYGKVRQLLPVK